MDEETMLATNTLFSIGSLISIPTPTKSKFEHEFQELGVELEKTYGKSIWPLFYRAGFTEYKIREAHRIATLKGINKIGYLIGIIRRMP
jgi:hypothetical protein